MHAVTGMTLRNTVILRMISGRYMMARMDDIVRVKINEHCPTHLEWKQYQKNYCKAAIHELILTRRLPAEILA